MEAQMMSFKVRNPHAIRKPPRKYSKKPIGEAARTVQERPPGRPKDHPDRGSAGNPKAEPEGEGGGRIEKDSPGKPTGQIDQKKEREGQHKRVREAGSNPLAVPPELAIFNRDRARSGEAEMSDLENFLQLLLEEEGPPEAGAQIEPRDPRGKGKGRRRGMSGEVQQPEEVVGGDRQVWETGYEVLPGALDPELPLGEREPPDFPRFRTDNPVVNLWFFPDDQDLPAHPGGLPEPPPPPRDLRALAHLRARLFPSPEAWEDYQKEVTERSEEEMAEIRKTLEGMRIPRLLVQVHLDQLRGWSHLISGMLADFAPTLTGTHLHLPFFCDHPPGLLLRYLEFNLGPLRPQFQDDLVARLRRRKEDSSFLPALDPSHDLLPVLLPDFRTYPIDQQGGLWWGLLRVATYFEDNFTLDLLLEHLTLACQQIREVPLDAQLPHAYQQGLRGLGPLLGDSPHLPHLLNWLDRGQDHLREMLVHRERF